MGNSFTRSMRAEPQAHVRLRSWSCFAFASTPIMVVFCLDCLDSDHGRVLPFPRLGRICTEQFSGLAWIKAPCLV